MTVDCGSSGKLSLQASRRAAELDLSGVGPSQRADRSLAFSSLPIAAWGRGWVAGSTLIALDEFSGFGHVVPKCRRVAGRRSGPSSGPSFVASF